MPPTSLRDVLTSAFEQALAYREADGQRPVAAMASHALLLSRLDVPLTDGGCDAAKVIEELVAAVDGGLHDTTGGRFFGWVIGGSLPSALAADWLTGAWDQNAGTFDVSPAASVVEEVAGKWLKEILGLPPEASFALVTGCQMAHVTCLAAARHRVLVDRGLNVELEGLAGAPAIRILTSSEKHGSVSRAARLLGIGEKNLVSVPCDETGRLPAVALEAALAENPTAPTLVVLQAGDLNIGAYDDFHTLIPLARRYGAWVHVDGAFGLWAAASEKLRHFCAGADMADSWATDGHKWLNVPYDSGFAFVRDAQSHRAAFAHTSVYVDASDSRDSMDFNPEWSRRGRGFSTYAALRELGRDGVAAMIERCCDHARALVTRMGALPGAEMLAEPRINQGLVRFLNPNAGATEADHATFTDRITRGILADGEAHFSNTTWRGKRAMRVSVCNWQTSAADVDRVVASVARVLEAARPPS